MPRRAWSNSGTWKRRTRRTEIEAWDAPFDPQSETSPRVKLAQRIAARCEALDGAAGLQPGRARSGAPARAAVRGDHPRAQERATSPVAGADRLVLTEHIAVMDLMALADALLLPDDDLALAPC